MAEYTKKAGFKKANFNKSGFGKNGGFKGGAKPFSKPFNKPYGPVELFSATCAGCGKACQVPFRPNGKKPVFCKECFAENGGPSADAPRYTSTPSSHRSEPTSDLANLTRQISAMNQKLDKLVEILQNKNR